MSKLWDMAGVDSVEVAQLVFGKQIGYLAPFQSVDIVLEGEECSVLRLCDHNFRIRYAGPLDRLIHPLQRCVSLQQYAWLSTLTIPTHQLSTLTQRATVRPPHRLEKLPNHQAVPARFKGISLLIWRHLIQEQSAIELHTAKKDLSKLMAQLDPLTHEQTPAKRRHELT